MLRTLKTVKFYLKGARVTFSYQIEQVPNQSLRVPLSQSHVPVRAKTQMRHSAALEHHIT